MLKYSSKLKIGNVGTVIHNLFFSSEKSKILQFFCYIFHFEGIME